MSAHNPSPRELRVSPRFPGAKRGLKSAVSHCGRKGRRASDSLNRSSKWGEEWLPGGKKMAPSNSAGRAEELREGRPSVGWERAAHGAVTLCRPRGQGHRRLVSPAARF